MQVAQVDRLAVAVEDPELIVSKVTLLQVFLFLLLLLVLLLLHLLHVGDGLRELLLDVLLGHVAAFALLLDESLHGGLDLFLVSVERMTTRLLIEVV